MLVLVLREAWATWDPKINLLPKNTKQIAWFSSTLTRDLSCARRVARSLQSGVFGPATPGFTLTSGTIHAPSAATGPELTRHRSFAFET